MNAFKFGLRLVLPLFLITAVVAAALGGINAITQDKIEAAQAQKVQQAIEKVLPEAENLKEAEVSFEEHPLVKAAYFADSGFAVQVQPAGFGGGISMMVGVDMDGKVLGVQVISHTETAGLGAVAGAETSAGQAFRDSFAGLTCPVSVSKDGGEADTLTGATITSRAVADGVNAALACAEQLRKEARP